MEIWKNDHRFNKKLYYVLISMFMKSIVSCAKTDSSISDYGKTYFTSHNQKTVKGLWT